MASGPQRSSRPRSRTRHPVGKQEATLPASADPVLHLIAGPNGAGKSTLHDTVIGPTTHLEFVNADLIAAKRWPDDAAARSYDAAVVAAERRSELIEARSSFVTETVFSHPSKLDLIHAAVDAGYLVTLHIVMVPEALAVARVANRVEVGGHAVPANKVRERYARLWPLVASAITVVDATTVYDNSRAAKPFRVVASFEHRSVVGTTDWPTWTPAALVIIEVQGKAHALLENTSKSAADDDT